MTPKLFQQYRIVIGNICGPIIHAEMHIDFVDAALNDLLFIEARVRAQDALQKGFCAPKGEDIQNNPFFIRLIRIVQVNHVLANVADGFGDGFIAGTAFVERGDQLGNAFLNICHVICLVFEMDELILTARRT
ncbi:MAG: hypothetical protein IPJ48_08495 [Propionivibrio sp.]|uniref:Uncharacterized protein n=1 Tax=Candidatus Propionivibrio dominans TaxID=2954373 RepID=A0A9D7FF21_9RHOO|nr:hypothetical protein [Candidatus Propionivibrio dominans]